VFWKEETKKCLLSREKVVTVWFILENWSLRHSLLTARTCVSGQCRAAIVKLSFSV
jgi:hypothetical protein